MIAIEKIILLVIFVIVLVVILLLLFGTANPIGSDINTRGQIMQCCSAYRANKCEDEEIICYEDATKIETLSDLAKKLNMEGNDYELLKKFCNCCKTWQDDKCIEWW